jgi:hypothetical protein
MSVHSPIFITGTDRSGTSLMFALLASHPQLSMVRRTNMWRWFYGRYGDLSEPENFERCLASMLRYKRLAVLHPDPVRIRHEFWQGEPSYGRLFALLHAHHAERIGKVRWGDKSLHTEHYADDVFREFPRAIIIHMVRDPRDRYTSVLRRYQERTKGLGAAMGRWMKSVHAAERNLRRYADNYITVCYETLAFQPRETLQTICDFVDLPYAPVMLQMRGVPEHGEQGGNSSFVRFAPGEISTRSIGRYRSMLSKYEIAFIQGVAKREMEMYDYPLETVEFSPGERLSYGLTHAPANLGRLAGWFVVNKVDELRGRSIPASRLAEAAPSGG